MDPLRALHEIAFWLEREGAPVFKVKAFRTAAAALEAIPAETVAARAADGSLGRVKGIGGRSMEVVRQAVRGEVPDYLADLRERNSGTLVEGGEGVRSALRGDLHAHTEWSDGGTSVATMLDAARTLGREYLAITDHSPTLTIANGLSVERLTEQLALLDRLDEESEDLVVLRGIEIDILEDGSLDQTPAMLDRLDVVVASVHSKLRSPADEMTERMLSAVRDPYTSVLGHCTGRLVDGPRAPRPQSAFDAERVFAACAEEGVAVEINSRPERRDPPGDLIAVALEAGCLFSIDTDAHAPGQLAFLDYGAERAERYGVPVDRIVTTWPVERLREWARHRR